MKFEVSRFTGNDDEGLPIWHTYFFVTRRTKWKDPVCLIPVLKRTGYLPLDFKQDDGIFDYHYKNSVEILDSVGNPILFIKVTER